MGTQEKQGKLGIARAYDVRDDGAGDAATFLVDRLWPRGVKKTDLLTWEQFGDAYRAELDERYRDGELDDVVAQLKDALAEGDVLLLFAGKDTDHTHARVLEGWLEQQL